jgi:hypothetical protein
MVRVAVRFAELRQANVKVAETVESTEGTPVTVIVHEAPAERMLEQV